MKVDGSLKSLLQGVSQQPPRDRLPGQCTTQQNMSADPISGLTRRPPSDLVGYLGSTSSLRGWHNFQSRDGSKFLAMFHDDTVEVFDLNATPKTVAVDADAEAYITLGGSLRFITDEQDETIVVNTSAVPQMNAAAATYYQSSAKSAGIVQILGGQYGRKYTINVNGVMAAEYTPRDGSVATHSADVTTTNIAKQLVLALGSAAGAVTPVPAGGTAASGGLTTGVNWSIVRKDDIILIVNQTGAEFSLTAADDAGNTTIKAMTDSVAATGELPRIAPHLYVARVAERTDPDLDLWFKFVVSDLADDPVPTSSAFGRAGYWQETTAPAVPTTLNAAMMPHILDYDGTGFTFKRGEWAGRAVGTLGSNPDPSFIGQPIEDVSSFQGRTVFLAGPNVIMSRTNRPKDFWLGSASALADSDPIDINSKIEASTMLAAVQHNRDLVIFSNKGQFVVFGRSSITPANAALVLTTQYEAELRARPVGAGRNVFFASNYGRFTGIHEFFAEGGTDINDSRPITQHVKRYITGKATLLSTSSNYSTLAVHTDANQTDMFIYQYIWADNEKVQGAWSTYKYGHDIVYSFFDEDVVYLVQKIEDAYYLLRMSLDVQNGEGLEYPVFMDQRFDVLDCYEAFLLPFDYIATEETMLCIQGLNCPNPGLPVPIESIIYSATEGGYVVTLKKNMLGGDLVVGTRYMSVYAPTMPMVKDTDNVAIGTGKLRIRNFLVSLYHTGEVIGRTLSKWALGPEVRFNARFVGDIDNTVGEQPLSDEKFVMPFRQDAQTAEVTFYTSSHLPLTILDIEWDGQYTKRGKRITTGGKA